jgi:hypothetical protein
MKSKILFRFPIFAVIALLCSCNSRKSVDPNEAINAQMASLSTKAVELAKSSYGITLDYSPDSVKSVEKLLAMKYDLQKTQPMSEDELADTAHTFGAYIGEVMKRVHPGHWERDSAMGKDTLPFTFDGSSNQAFPCAWIYHRLQNGEEDNVWTKFYFSTQPGGLKQYFPAKKTLDKPGSKSSPQ